MSKCDITYICNSAGWLVWRSGTGTTPTINIICVVVDRYSSSFSAATQYAYYCVAARE